MIIYILSQCCTRFISLVTYIIYVPAHGDVTKGLSLMTGGTNIFCGILGGPDYFLIDEDLKERGVHKYKAEY